MLVLVAVLHGQLASGVWHVCTRSARISVAHSRVVFHHDAAPDVGRLVVYWCRGWGVDFLFFFFFFIPLNPRVE